MVHVTLMSVVMYLQLIFHLVEMILLLELPSPTSTAILFGAVSGFGYTVQVAASNKVGIHPVTTSSDFGNY